MATSTDLRAHDAREDPRIENCVPRKCQPHLRNCGEGLSFQRRDSHSQEHAGPDRWKPIADALQENGGNHSKRQTGQPESNFALSRHFGLFGANVLRVVSRFQLPRFIPARPKPQSARRRDAEFAERGIACRCAAMVDGKPHPRGRGAWNACGSQLEANAL